jgi:hypothetical protein
LPYNPPKTSNNSTDSLEYTWLNKIISQWSERQWGRFLHQRQNLKKLKIGASNLPWRSIWLAHPRVYQLLKSPLFLLVFLLVLLNVFHVFWSCLVMYKFIRQLLFSWDLILLLI